MTSPDQLSARHSSTAPTYRLSFNVGSLVRGLTKAALSFLGGTGSNPISAATAVTDALKIEQPTEHKAWVLVFSAVARALGAILSEYDAAHGLPPERAASFLTQNYVSDDVELTLDANFFYRPKPDELIRPISSGLRTGLAALNISDIDSQNILERLPGYLTVALHQEWASEPSYYQSIEDYFKSPFSDAVKAEQEWHRYRALLSANPDEHLFDESFSLRQIYVRPRAYYKEVALEELRDLTIHDPATGGRPTTNIVVDLESAVKTWVFARSPEFTSLVLSGGPGSGKSSYARILAAEVAAIGSYVLFIPLHQLDVDKGVAAAIEAYLKESGYFSESPLRTLNTSERLLIILDGLDELQMQGRAAQESAQGFIEEVLRYLDRVNTVGTRVMALITGREIAVQSAETFFRGTGQVLHLLPYYVPKERDSDAPRLEVQASYSDPSALLSLDQRDEWWLRYGRLTGLNYAGLPEALKKGELGEVTSQPLLNYLVALSYRRGGLALTENTNVNFVYRDLLEAVHERSWAPSRHPTTQALAFEEFVRLLEEVALSVWHGAGRTTTLREVEEHCEKSKVKALLPSFTSGSEAGVSNLLLAFYFRQKGRRRDGEKTFEFTHKTFAEYLISLRAVRAIKQICTQLDAHLGDSDTGWSEEDCLERWTTVFGPTELDHYLRLFVIREVATRPKDAVRRWQSTLARMLEYGLAVGWPMNRFNTLRFQDQLRWYRNAESALLICVNACSRMTEELTEIKWPDATSLGDLLKRLQGQREGGANRPFQSSLSYLRGDGQILHMADLYNADLSYSSFQACGLEYANLAMADLRHVNFSQTQIGGAMLEHARVAGATFTDFGYLHAYVNDPRSVQIGRRGTTNVAGILRRLGAVVENAAPDQPIVAPNSARGSAKKKKRKKRR